MQGNLVRTVQLVFCLATGMVTTLPGIASPADSRVSVPAASSAVIASIGHQPAPIAAPAPLMADDCSHLTHQNFCYCTDSPCHDEESR